MHMQREMLVEEVARLPLEKVGKAISFIRYLERETDAELWLDPAEEAELRLALASGETVDSAELLAKIEGLPDD